MADFHLQARSFKFTACAVLGAYLIQKLQTTESSQLGDCQDPLSRENGTQTSPTKDIPNFTRFWRLFVPFLVGATVVARFNTLWMAPSFHFQLLPRLFRQSLWKLGQWILPEIVIRDRDRNFPGKMSETIQVSRLFCQFGEKYWSCNQDWVESLQPSTHGVRSYREGWTFASLKWWLFYGDSTIHHHFSPPFGEDFCHFFQPP